MQDFIQEIREFLAATGLKPTQLSEQSGISRERVTRWLAGECTPGPLHRDAVRRRMQAVREALGVG